MTMSLILYNVPLLVLITPYIFAVLVLLIVEQISLIDAQLFIAFLCTKLFIYQKKNRYFGVSFADVVIHVVIQILDHTSLLILKVTTAAVVITQHLRELLTFTIEKLFLSAITIK